MCGGSANSCSPRPDGTAARQGCQGPEYFPIAKAKQPRGNHHPAAKMSHALARAAPEHGAVVVGRKLDHFCQLAARRRYNGGGRRRGQAQVYFGAAWFTEHRRFPVCRLPVDAANEPCGQSTALTARASRAWSGTPCKVLVMSRKSTGSVHGSPRHRRISSAEPGRRRLGEFVFGLLEYIAIDVQRDHLALHELGKRRRDIAVAAAEVEYRRARSETNGAQHLFRVRPQGRGPTAGERQEKIQARLAQIVGRNAHDQDVDLEVKASLIVLHRCDLREARTIAQQAAGILGFARWCRLFEACEQSLTDVHAHRPIVVRHKE